MLLVYYVAVGKFLGAEQVPGKPGGIPAFAIFIFTGLTAWQLFSDIIVGGTGSVVVNGGLIKKVYLPREVFPLSVIGAALVNFLIQLGILIGATIVIGQFPVGGRWLYFVVALAVLTVFSTALALLLAAVNVYLRDVQYLVEIMIMILLWVSPIIYSWKFVDNALDGIWQSLYLANPMTQVVLGFQKAFWVAGDVEPYPENLMQILLSTLGLSVLLLWVCQRVFSRLQANFAQEL
jgi:ABC-2 type transport system permease protein